MDKWKEIKIKIDINLFNRAKEYGIDIEDFVNNELFDLVNEISNLEIQKRNLK